MQTKQNYKMLFFTCAALGGLSIVFLYDMLMGGAGWGINIPIFIFLFYGAVFISFKGSIDLKREQNWALLVLIICFCTTFALYNNTLLLFLNTVALLILVPLQISAMTGQNTFIPYSVAAISDVCYFLLVRPFHKIKDALLGFFPTEDKNKARRTKILGSILVAIAILLPLMAILTILLASADLVFSGMLENVIRLLSIKTVFDAFGWIFLFTTVFLTFASATTSLWTVKRSPAEKPAKAPKRTDILVIYIILIASSILLIVFSAIQGIFLFGSAKLPKGYTYSQYARTGFFQLCAAAVIVLSLPAICMRFTKQATKSEKVFLNILYSILLSCTLVLIASSFLRLVLYEQEYLFTRLRLYVQAFLVLLALITAFVIMKVWKDKLNIGKWIFFSVMVCLLALSFFNVDLFIGTQNTIDLDKSISIEDTNGQSKYKYYDPVSYRADPPSDLDYLLTLSVDALPGYIDKISADDFRLQNQKYSEYEEAYSYNIVTALRASRFLRLVQEVNGQYAEDLRYCNLSRETAETLLLQKQDVISAAKQFLKDFKATYRY